MKAKVEVPRVRDKETGKEIPLKSYHELQNKKQVHTHMLGKLLGGLSLRRYTECASMLASQLHIEQPSLYLVLSEFLAKK